MRIPERTKTSKEVILTFAASSSWASCACKTVGNGLAHRIAEVVKVVHISGHGASSILRAVRLRKSMDP